MKRRQIRESIFKMLFRVEFYKNAEGYSEEELKEQLELFSAELNVESDPNEEQMAYITSKYNAIVEKLETIDASINEKTTGWKTSRMSKVDLAILRLAVYEITFEEDIPVKVSINEAVELAKSYGSDDSAAFVNGVLAKFA